VHQPFARYPPANCPILGADGGYAAATLHGHTGIFWPYHRGGSESLALHFVPTTYFPDQEGLGVSPEFEEDVQLVLGPSVAPVNATVQENDLSGCFDTYTDTGTLAGFSGTNIMIFGAEDPFIFEETPGGALMATMSVPPPIVSTLSRRIPAIPNIPQPSGQGPLACPFGCRGTFGRSVEYRRHMSKHNGLNLPCTQPGCSSSFYRRDKLNYHLRQGHGIAVPRRARAAAVIGANTTSTTGANQG
jgi:hypothetical protein